MLSDLIFRLRSLFRRKSMERELDDELRSHIEHQQAKYLSRGLSPEEASRKARLEFGGVDQIKEECRQARGVEITETLVQDVRFSLRMLRKSLGFTTTAVLTLALAIAANAVVFGVLNAFILRPIDLPQVESLYGIERITDSSARQSYLDYLYIRDRNRSFQDLAAYNLMQAGVDTGDDVYRTWGVEASGNYFDALGIHPYSCRFFHD